jgi:dihydroorotase
MQYDLLLRGGRVIDPAAKIDGNFDVAIKDGKIAAVQQNIMPSAAKQVTDVSGKLVLPGLLDTHGHIFQHVTGRFGLDADLAGVQSGVTTLIDQGGASCMTLPAFREYVVNAKKSNVLAFLSAYLVGGMEGHYYASLYKPDCLDVDATVRAAKENSDIVRGFKAHAEIGGFARWGLKVMEMSAQIGTLANLPLYIHFGQLWPLPESGTNGVDPDSILPDVVKLLKAGDVLAHPFSKHTGSFVDKNGKLHPIVKEALAKGLKVDVGHGSHFSFDSARRVVDAGVIPDTLGADMHGYNTRVPQQRGTPNSHPDTDHMFFGTQRFSLVSAMTSMLAIGFKLEQVVPMVTSNCARMVGMTDTLGTLKPGVVADVSVLNDERGVWTLEDNEGHKVKAERMLTPAFCIRQGVRYDSDASILPVAKAA